MSSAALVTSGDLRTQLHDRQRVGFWGMILFITTEASFFGLLLFGYLYLGAIAPGRWPPDGLPPLHLVLPNTAILLLSSGTMRWGEVGIRRGNQGRLRLGLLLTFLLGVAFLWVQRVEFGQQHFSPTADAYGSLFFTIIGFHAAHVAIGLLMNLYVQLLAWRGHVTSGRHLVVTNSSWYWHFVDAVWIAVFVSLYLVPRLTG